MRWLKKNRNNVQISDNKAKKQKKKRGEPAPIKTKEEAEMNLKMLQYNARSVALWQAAQCPLCTP